MQKNENFIFPTDLTEDTENLHREHSQRGCAECRSKATCKSVKSVPSVGDLKKLSVREKTLFLARHSSH